MQGPSTRNIRVMHAHWHAGHHRDARIPVETGAMRDHALSGGERLPLRGRFAPVERPGVLDADRGHDRLPVLQYGAEVTLNWLGKTLQLTSVEGPGLDREPGGLESGA